MSINKLLSYPVSNRISLMLIGGVVLLILFYVTYRIGKLNGLNHSSVDRFNSTSSVALEEIPEFNKIYPEYLEVDANSLITIKDTRSAHLKRNQLIQFVWGNTGLPLNAMPSKIVQNVQDQPLEGLNSTFLDRTDHILVTMDFGLESHIYHLIPYHRTHQALVIYHQGHLRSTMEEVVLINNLLERGYSVGVFCMPLCGWNNRPTVFVPSLGYLKLQQHDHMKFLVPECGHPVKYFLQPVIEFINYAAQSSDHTNFSMIGLSGGGWTTTLIAAIDPRIDLSVSVAGSYPIFLRSLSPRDWGDWEQTIPGLYQTCNYLELYILGAVGKGRKQLQIINKYDSCCFAGIKWQTYDAVIKKHVEMIGEGDWDLFLDESHGKHMISTTSRGVVISALKDLASRTRGRP